MKTGRIIRGSVVGVQTDYAGGSSTVTVSVNTTDSIAVLLGDSVEILLDVMEPFVDGKASKKIETGQ